MRHWMCLVYLLITYWNNHITGTSTVCSTTCWSWQQKHHSCTLLSFCERNTPVTSEFPLPFARGKISRKRSGCHKSPCSGAELGSVDSYAPEGYQQYGLCTHITFILLPVVSPCAYYQVVSEHIHYETSIEIPQFSAPRGPIQYRYPVIIGIPVIKTSRSWNRLPFSLESLYL